LDEDRCRALSAAFYARVGKDPVLKPLFPGKSLRCATEEFAALVIQFLGGDQEQTQKRWWLSLRESHAQFRISPEQRAAWLRHMAAALDEVVPGDAAFRQFFLQSSSYVVGGEAGRIEDPELAERWDEQLALDDAVARGEPQLARRFAGRRSVFVGLLARMMQSGHADFVVDALERDLALGRARFGGRTLLHYACGAGCVELYRVANECGSAAGPEIVRMLVAAGADVDARGGVTRSTPLHMAARRGFVDIARILIDRGADTGAVDRKGDTPLQRAINCRKSEVARLIADRNR
jgi:hemoglobin